MKIGIIGGSFDPPHKGHMLVAKRLSKLFNFDQILLLPCYKHPFNKKISPANYRFAMTAYLENENIKVSDFELQRKGTSYTIDTLKLLARNSPKDQFFWIIGSDQVKSFKQWKNWQEILEKFKLIIVPRNEVKEAKLTLKKILKEVKNKKNAIFLEKKQFSPINISSSKVRRRIKEGKKIASFVPKEVESYIIQHKLYV